jgi:hypothetical protein
MDRVVPVPGSNSRVSCTTVPPSSMSRLPPRLVLDRLHDEADRVDVLGLGRVPNSAPAAHRHVDVGAHGAFLHVAVARSDIAQDAAQLADVRPASAGRAHIGRLTISIRRPPNG